MLVLRDLAEAELMAWQDALALDPARLEVLAGQGERALDDHVVGGDEVDLGLDVPRVGQQAAKDPALARRIQDTLVELLPIAAMVFVPPGHDPSVPWEILGYASDEINQFAYTALTRRLKVIGVSLPTVAA